MTLVTLVAGADIATREVAIATCASALLQAGASCAVILEGGHVESVRFSPAVRIARIAPGCPCCVGNLTMRVVLNRMLRHVPSQIFISLLETSHSDALRQFLSQPPYDTLLKLDDDLLIGCD